MQMLEHLLPMQLIVAGVECVLPRSYVGRVCVPLKHSRFESFVLLKKPLECFDLKFC
jgi:hypothetical protein